MTKALPFTEASLARAIKAVEPVVYFAEIGDRIKIGFSTNVANRMKTFRTSSTNVELLLVIPGDRALEARFRCLFAEQRIEREIFRRDPRILDFISHVEYGGLDRGLRYLEATTPQRRKQAKQEARAERERVARQTKAEKDAYFASLVAGRKERVGW